MVSSDLASVSAREKACFKVKVLRSRRLITVRISWGKPAQESVRRRDSEKFSTLSLPPCVKAVIRIFIVLSMLWFLGHASIAGINVIDYFHGFDQLSRMSLSLVWTTNLALKSSLRFSFISISILMMLSSLELAKPLRARVNLLH